MITAACTSSVGMKKVTSKNPLNSKRAALANMPIIKCSTLVASSTELLVEVGAHTLSRFRDTASTSQVSIEIAISFKFP